MELLKIRDIRSSDFYSGKGICTNGVVISIENVKPIIKEIKIKCKSCDTTKTIYPDRNGIFNETKVCDCRKKLEEDPFYTDMGYLYIADPFENSESIKVQVNDEETFPEKWNKIKIGSRIEIVGSIKTEGIEKNNLKYYIEAKELKIGEKLNNEEKKLIILNRIKIKPHYRTKKGIFYKNILSLGIPEEDISEIISLLIKENKIECFNDKGRETIIPKYLPNEYYNEDSIDIQENEDSIDKRKKIVDIINIISNLQKEQKEVAIEDVKAEAENRGIDNTNEILKKLRTDGEIYSRREGFIIKT